MKASIHPSAIVHPDATIAENVNIGPYAWIREDVIIGPDCEIGSHVILLPGVRLGKSCQVYHHAVLGEVPQDLKFGGEKTTAEIGDRTVIREFVTINRGTQARGATRVGSDCLLMAYTHVAHDCVLGNHVIMSNAASLAGHIDVEDWVIISGLVGVHQFCRIGQHSMIGGLYRVTKDVPPYIIAANEPLAFCGLNVVGLKRRGFPADTIQALKKAYQLIYRSSHNVTDAVRILEQHDNRIPEVQNILDFIQKSERGIIR